MQEQEIIGALYLGDQASDDLSDTRDTSVQLRTLDPLPSVDRYGDNEQERDQRRAATVYSDEDDDATELIDREREISI